MKMISDQSNETWKNVRKALTTILQTARVFDHDHDANCRSLLLDPQVVAYEWQLLQTGMTDSNVPFDLVIDHHLSWDQTGSWIAYFKDLYKRLPDREGRLLHAAIKIIVSSENYTGSEKRLMKMISDTKNETWKTLASALTTVLVSAKNLDPDSPAGIVPVNLDPALFGYALDLSERIVPSLHVPFDLVIDHHLSWDQTGSWIAYFKDLYKRLPAREGRLLHAAIKIIVSSEILHFPQKRSGEPQDREAFPVCSRPRNDLLTLHRLKAKLLIGQQISLRPFLMSFKNFKSYAIRWIR
jgi:hypothetical protein